MNTLSNATDLPQARPRPDAEQAVVIADADEENASHVERQLRRAGVKNPVIIFKNGDDLHAFLADAAQTKTPAPCVLFLDPRMPGANGYFKKVFGMNVASAGKRKTASNARSRAATNGQQRRIVSS